MNPKEIREIAINSAEVYYKYLADNDKGLQIIEVFDIKQFKREKSLQLELRLSAKIVDVESIVVYLQTNNKKYPVVQSKYDTEEEEKTKEVEVEKNESTVLFVHYDENKYTSRIKYSEIVQADNRTFLGFLTENYVAQVFTANKIPLYYWNSGNRAEIDIVANLADGIIPIEVLCTSSKVELKSGRNVGSKSLSVYVEKFKPPYSIRISAKNFGFENGIKSVPLYAAFCI